MSDCHWTDRTYIDFMGYKVAFPNILCCRFALGWTITRSCATDSHAQHVLDTLDEVERNNAEARVESVRVHLTEINVGDLLSAFLMGAHVVRRTVGIELYSHAGDDGMASAAFDDFENINLAGEPQFQHVQEQLLQQLRTMAEKWMTPLVPK